MGVDYVHVHPRTHGTRVRSTRKVFGMLFSESDSPIEIRVFRNSRVDNAAAAAVSCARMSVGRVTDTPRVHTTRIAYSCCVCIRCGGASLINIGTPAVYRVFRSVHGARAFMQNVINIIYISFFLSTTSAHLKFKCPRIQFPAAYLIMCTHARDRPDRDPPTAVAHDENPRALPYSK